MSRMSTNFINNRFLNQFLTYLAYKNRLHTDTTEYIIIRHSMAGGWSMDWGPRPLGPRVLVWIRLYMLCVMRYEYTTQSVILTFGQKSYVVIVGKKIWEIHREICMRRCLVVQLSCSIFFSIVVIISFLATFMVNKDEYKS